MTKYQLSLRLWVLNSPPSIGSMIVAVTVLETDNYCFMFVVHKGLNDVSFDSVSE